MRGGNVMESTDYRFTGIAAGIARGVWIGRRADRKLHSRIGQADRVPPNVPELATWAIGLP